MKKLLVTLSSVVVVIALFTVVAYGSDWLNFNGKDQLNQSAADVEEILGILEQVHTDKMTTEDALEKLRAMDPHGLLEENGELKETVKGLEADVSALTKDKERLTQEKAILTTDLAAKQTKVDNKQKEIDEKIAQINEKNNVISQKNDEINKKQDTINEKDAVISQKDAEIKRKQTSIDNLTNQTSDLETKLAEEKSKNKGNTDYIAHLENELEDANEAVAAYGGTTKSAVEKARTYVNN